jgi:hypothetical protein
VSYLLTPLPLLLPFLSPLLAMGGCFSSPSASVPFDYEAQLHSARAPAYSAIVNPNEPVKHETHTRRHPDSVNGLCTAIYPKEPHPILTIWDAFQRGVRLSRSSPCLGTRPFELSPAGTVHVGDDGFPVRADYVWATYAEVDVEAREIGIGLATLGYEPQSNIGIYSKVAHSHAHTDTDTDTLGSHPPLL